MRTSAVYRVGDDNEFIIENYNHSKAFSSFLPGIAGLDGIPMWTFYVNRNQAVCSFGIEGKDRSMMEFLPANFAYQLVGTQGFRTFIKISSKSGHTYYEPFRTYEKEEKYIPSQTMVIRPYSVTIKEENRKLGLDVKVEYCNLSGQPFPGLMRKVEIRNISGKKVSFELIDGMPQVVPFGMDDFSLKKMKYLVKSFSFVENLKKKIPYFHIKTTHEDGPEVAMVKKGHFYACFRTKGGKMELLRPMVDVSQIFGMRKDFMFPSEFNVKKKFSYDAKNELKSGEFACAMCYQDVKLAPAGSAVITSVFGTLDSLEETSKVARAVTADLMERQLEKNRELIESVMARSLVVSEDRRFDRYSLQNYLDNVLRGGLPITVTKDKSKVFYVYSRKHGDLERDYNQFYTSPTEYSQGDSNYRDVNQNRRNDAFFNPDVGMTNIVNYVSLIQLDGFNPHGVGGITFRYKGGKETLKPLFGTNAVDAEAFLDKPFTPGDLFKFLDAGKIKTGLSKETLLSGLLERSEAIQNSKHIEGYWSDHTFYNMDLIESFLSVFPDRKKELFLDNKGFTFHDSMYVVMPREEKYVLWDGKPIQAGSVRLDEEKKQMITDRASDNNLVRKENGKGEVYRTNLITKLFILAVNKINSIAPDGCGVEMESDKPNWCDALNGLPGMFGSSSNETFELKRLISLVSDNIGAASLELPEEVADAVSSSRDVLGGYLSGDLDDYAAWDKLTSIKEEFRKRTKFGITGRMVNLTADEASKYLNLAAKRVQSAVNKSFDEKSGLFSGYFTNVPVEYEKITCTDDKGREVAKTNHKGLPCIRVKKFESKALPLFLEAQVHAMRTEKDLSLKARLHGNLMNSALVDRKLKMLFVNDSIAKEPYEIGRTKTFNPGWLENQSIWLHMEYKYMLELIRGGLYKEFFRNMKNVLIPFLPAEVYGRSIFENSSFIASSAHPDKKVHGQGFYARLSGSTAEFIHMWLIMMTGGRPFGVEGSGKLIFKLCPVIEGGMFLKKDRKVSYYLPDGTPKTEIARKGTLKFMFLGSIPVTYINSAGKDIFGDKGNTRYEITLDDATVKSFDGEVPEPYSVMIRDRKIREIKVYFN